MSAIVEKEKPIIKAYTKEIFQENLSFLAEEINGKKGALFSSNYEFPDRYSRWETAAVDPFIEVRASGLNGVINALNSGGISLLKIIHGFLKDIEAVELDVTRESISFTIKKDTNVYTEEERSKKNTIFTVIRAIINGFKCDDPWLGFYGAFGYDLVFQFEDDIKLKKSRENSEDLVLYVPERIYVKDNKLAKGYVINYEISLGDISTTNKEEFAPKAQKCSKVLNEETYKPGDYGKLVVKAKESFRRGDLFEVVPSYSVVKETALKPKEIYNNLKEINPSPYNFFINLGGEYLIGSSPEMFVRVENNKVETCPISGTIKRGMDSIEDSEQIKKLLNSKKDEDELTMCTDVDRNDKSRVCVEGSVRVVSRRTIEKYSHLFHTVDHVEGMLKPGFDSIDAFLTHMWAVTLTGAPKKRAIEWIENEEADRRNWYGGAIGYLKFNGDFNTGITIRTVRYIDNKVEIRAGATLLISSDEVDEEEETKTKAAAMLKSLEVQKPIEVKVEEKVAVKNKRILMIDHEDSFVHTLGNYVKALGYDVTTFRGDEARRKLKEENFDLLLLSPGPGTPSEFKLNESIDIALSKNIPVFGVCLGLQGIVEYFGGSLDYLANPRHGKKMKVKKNEKAPWSSLKDEFSVGLYHSIYGKNIGNELINICEDEEGILMGVMHKDLKILGVQFHPESIMTLENSSGMSLLKDTFEYLLN